MAQTNNPAGRLLYFLEEAKKLDKKAHTKNQLSVLLNSKSSESIFYKRLGLFVNLPNEIKAIIESQVNINHKLLLKWQPKLDSVFRGLNFLSPFNHFIDNITDIDLYGLEFCSDHLSRNCPEKTISDSEIDTFKKDAEDLLNAINECDINEKLKSYSIEKVEDLLSNLNHW